MSPIYIGDDVVDLEDLDAVGKSSDARFVARVFTDAERELIARAAAPDLALWTLWTAKEAAFKALSKVVPDLPFAHRRFVVTPLDDERATVHHAAGSVAVRFARAAGFVHCLGWWTGGLTPPTDPAVPIATAIRDRGDADPSVAARELARALALSLAPDLAQDVEIDRPDPSSRVPGPPRLTVAGRPLAGWDVSLSHSGRFVSAAVCSNVVGGGVAGRRGRRSIP